MKGVLGVKMHTCEKEYGPMMKQNQKEITIVID